MAKNGSITISDKYIQLVKKNVVEQYETLSIFHILPEGIMEESKKIAEKVGWQSGEPQCISQAILSIVLENKKSAIPFKEFNRIFKISNRTWKKWRKVVNDL